MHRAVIKKNVQKIFLSAWEMKDYLLHYNQSVKLPSI